MTPAADHPPITHRFDRHECKYLLTEAQAVKVRQRLEPFLEFDPYARRSGGHYRIASLYLDSPTMKLHRETLEGIRNRQKLRIRTYSDDPESPVFLEIKRRRNAVISKLRSPVTKLLAQTIIGQGDIGAISGPGVEARDDFINWVKHHDARPVVCVRYVREAYMSTVDPDSRVTFDRRIECNATNRVLLDGSGWVMVEPRRVVLELKFNGLCPSWMLDTIGACQLRRTSYSKYSTSVIAASKHGHLANSGLGTTSA